MRLSACSPAATAIFAASISEASRIEESGSIATERTEDTEKSLILSVSSVRSVAHNLHSSNFGSGLDIFLDSVEYFRLNKSEISQASGSSSK
jgi:hypothetical protein